MSSVCYFAKIAKMFVITLIPPNFFVISCQRYLCVVIKGLKNVNVS